jgi:hypothetical protein
MVALKDMLSIKAASESSVDVLDVADCWQDILLKACSAEIPKKVNFPFIRHDLNSL